MTDYRQFVETVLHVKVVTLKEHGVFMLATALMRDPLIKERHDALYEAWWNSNPFKDLPVYNRGGVEGSADDDGRLLEGDQNFKIEWPDFYWQVAKELTRNEQIALRKKYCP